MCHSASALHEFGNRLCLALVPSSLLQVTHFSLSQPFLKGRFSTPSVTLFSTSLGFSQLSNIFPKVWKSFLSQDPATAKLDGKIVPCLLQCAPLNRHPRRTAGFLQHWISAVLPSITALGLFPHGSSLANCSSSCI